MSEIVSVDFGKERNETVRRFARLMGIVEAHERDVLEDPLKYLDDASNRMCRIIVAVQEAQDMLRPTVQIEPFGPTHYEPLKTVTVTLEEYTRLRAAAKALQAIRP